MRKKPHSIKLDTGSVIPGLNIALNSMRKLETARFLIKPNYAYGSVSKESAFFHIFIIFT